MQNNTVSLDFDTFVSLFEEYYLSDDPGALGNFINGKLSYDDVDSDADDADPGALANTDGGRRDSSTSIRCAIQRSSLRPLRKVHFSLTIVSRNFPERFKLVFFAYF